MTITGLHHYNIRAHQPLLDEIRDFYVNVIGLHEGFRPPFQSKGYWLYADGAALIHLTEASTGEIRASKSQGTIDHVAFACQNPDTYISRLKAQHIAFLLDSVPGQRGLQIFVRDPAGNGVELNFSLTELDIDKEADPFKPMHARDSRTAETSGCQIRKLSPSDAEIFHTLRLQALIDAPTSFGASIEEEQHFTHEQVAARLEPKPDQAVFGAFRGDRLIGIVALARESKRKLQHKGMIFGLHVQPEARRLGIGRALLEAALNMADQTPGVLQVDLAVNAHNTAAISIYEQLGFRRYGLEPSSLMHEGVLHDELHMKRIRSP